MKNQTRFRLSDFTARKLGCIPNISMRYRLSKEQIKELHGFDQAKIKRLFFDIETSPNIGYFWRAGFKLNIGTENIIEERKIICISYKFEDEEKIHTLTWDKNQCDRKMLLKFMEIINKSDEAIGHNGDRFDLKWIRTRCIYHRIPMFPYYRTLDTLKKSRGIFNFNSNRLDYIAKFLGVGAKVKHDGFDMWKDVMRGDKVALQNMVTYCEGDIIVLEDVFLTMQNYIKHNTHSGVINGKLKASCPNCASENVSLLKNDVTPVGTIKRKMGCNSCGYTYDISNSAYKNHLILTNNLDKL